MQTPRLPPGALASCVLRIGLAVLLIVAAVGLLRQTRHEIVVDASLPRLRANELENPLSRAREIRVRQVLATDPGNAAAVEMLSEHLVKLEKQRLADGYLALIQEESLRECLAMLERRRRVYAAVPDTTRLQAEIHQLLAEVYRLRGDDERAKVEAQAAAEAYRRGMRQLPEPRLLPDEFYIGSILASAITEDAPELIDVVQRMDRDWRRYAIHEWAMYNDVSRAYYALGMHGHQVREMRYALVWEAWDERVLPGMRLAALALDQEIAVRNSLRSVRPRDHPERDAQRLELLEELETMQSAPLAPIPPEWSE